MLEAAIEALVAQGMDNLTVGAIAEQAGASKATIYSWYGGRDGLLVAVVERESTTAAHDVETALKADIEMRARLIGLGRTLLTHLTGPRMVALHRAAMGSREVAKAVLNAGLTVVGPIIARAFARFSREGELEIPDATVATQVFYALCVRDVQMRALIGDEPPTSASITADAVTATDAFLALYGPTCRHGQPRQA